MMTSPVIEQLREMKQATEQELQKINRALAALTQTNGHGLSPRLSAAATERISRAQTRRWRNWRATQKPKALHWTQRPENRAKVKRNLAAMAAAKA